MLREAAVVGLPDPQWGETPHAFVVLKPGAAATADAIRAFTREHLAHFSSRIPTGSPVCDAFIA